MRPDSARFVDCQHGVDVKAFKGKGARDLLSSYQKTVDGMYELAASTKSVAARSMLLVVHRRAGTGQASLRWRMNYGGWRHVKWGDALVEGLLDRMSVDWRSFYVASNGMAVELNKQEMSLRQQIRSLRAE
jgi:hypothetical protein